MEGPSIVILKEEVRQFEGMTIISVSGNSKIDQSRISGRRVFAFGSWGKHFLVYLEDLTLRIHFMMFGSYRINERKDMPVRLSLAFENGEINFYSCSVRIIEEDPCLMYDFTADVLNDKWNPRKAKAKLKAAPGVMVCDALLDQDIFAGVGNIIKNEVLYRIRIHPESVIGAMPDARIKELIKEARNYSFEFLGWKRKFELKKHWLAHTKKTCPRCNLPFIRKHTGIRNRRSFFCPNCQRLYA